MLDSATYVGGLPIGAIVSGQFAGNMQFALCNGQELLKSAYPSMSDFTEMTTFGSNVVQTRTMPSSSQWAAVAFGNGVFVAVSMTSGTAAASSADGIAWTARTIPSGVYRAVAFVASLGLFVAVGNAVCATSPDGVTWTARTMAGNMGSLTFGKGLLVAGPAGLFAGGDTTAYYTSPDGITWTARSMPLSASYGSFRYCDDRFIASVYTAGGSASQNAYSSLDGVTWVLTYAPLVCNSYNVESFKGRLFWSSSAYQLVTLQEGAYVGATTSLYPGWNFAGDGLYGATSQLVKVGEWLLRFSSSGILAASVDGQTWRPIATLPSMTINAAPGHMAFGNGVLVILSGAAATTNVYSLSADTTKFRLPRIRPFSEVERPYMKVA